MATAFSHSCCNGWKRIFVVLILSWTYGKSTTYHNFSISPLSIFLRYQKYISAHIYTNYYSLKGHKMVFNALTYYLLSGDCLSFLSYLLFFHIQSFSIQPCIYLDFAFVRLANSHNYFIGEKIWIACIVYWKENRDMRLFLLSNHL